MFKSDEPSIRPFKGPLQVDHKRPTVLRIVSQPIALAGRFIKFFFSALLTLHKDILLFLGAWVLHLLKRPVIIAKEALFYIAKLAKASSDLKSYFVRKLLWGRGKLTRPATHITLAGLTTAVFITSSTASVPTIIKGNMYPIGDVLAATTDVIPEPIQTETTLPSDRPADEPFTYTVKPGDSLSSIGEYFNVTVDTIRYSNDLTDSDYIKPGQELTILPVNGVKVTVKSGDTVETLAKKYKVSPQAIVDFNYLNEPFILAVGDELIIPDAQIPQSVNPAAPAYRPYPDTTVYGQDAYVNIPYDPSAAHGTGNFIWPTNFRIITQYFSRWHPALDIAPFSPLYASDSGTVIRAGWWPQGYGYAVQIDHGNGYTTTYAHMSRIDVAVGQQVSQGQVIGLMGNTGRSFGTHLHFVVQYNGQYVNPLSVL